MHCNQMNRRKRRGFSLPEVMLVIAILGILSTVATVSIRGVLSNAKVKTTQTEMTTFANSLHTYFSLHNAYPSSSEGLQILKDNNLIEVADLNDAWGNPYQYISPGRQGEDFEIISLGGDNQEGGTGTNADISSSFIVE